MMKRVLKWVGIVLGALIVVLLIAGGVLYYLGGRAWNKVYKPPKDSVTIPTSADAVEKGKHIAITHDCTGCHLADLSGGDVFIDDPKLITIVTANLTSGKGGAGGKMKDQDWVNAIRYGVDRKGHGLFIMPSEIFYNLSDEDLGNLIAYVKSVPPVDKQNPDRKVGPMGRLFMALGQFPSSAELAAARPPRAAPVTPGPTAEYGKYIASTLCILCHGDNLAGALFPPGQPDAKMTPNLTPGGELLVWTKDDFIKTLRTGVTPGGQKLDTQAMPTSAIGQMTDDELTAVYAYLKSLPKTPSPTKQ
jgi:mono/diheme cytochrome c family protein